MLDNVYRRQFIETNDIILHTIEAGDESDPLVILLHGFPEFWYGWRHQINAIAESGHYVLVPDQRGYGRSEKPTNVSDYKVETLVKDIIGLIDYAEREKAIIIGHDWGAIVAWWLAILYPERVEKLGILNVPHPTAFRKIISKDFNQMRRSWYVMMFQVPRLPEFIMSLGGYNFAAWAMKSIGLEDTFTDEDIVAYKRAWQRHGAMQSMINWYRAARMMPDVKDTRVKVPTLMIWGKKDKALGFQLVKPSIDMCDDGTLVVIPDATHWVQHDAKEQVTELLVKWVTGQLIESYEG